MGGITAVLMVALVGLFVLWRKYTELADVRNGASISSNQLEDIASVQRETALYQSLEQTKETN